MPGEGLITRIAMLVCTGAIAWLGMGFLAFAITEALEPFVGLAGGAAITAFLLVLPLLVTLLVIRRHRAAKKAAEASLNVGTVLATLAALIREVPVTGLVSAALLGVVDLWLKRRRKP